MHHKYRRRVILSLILLIATLPNSILAQDTTRHWSRPNALKTNAFAPLSLFYERALTRRFTLQTSGRWFRYGSLSNRITFTNATIEGRFYTAKLARWQAKSHPTGFFLSPYVKARSRTSTHEIGFGFNKVGDIDEIEIKSIGFGLTVGYQWVLRRGFVVELVYGGGFLPPALTSIRHTMRYSTVVSNQDYIPVDIRSGVNLGYAF